MLILMIFYTHGMKFHVASEGVEYDEKRDDDSWEISRTNQITRYLDNNIYVYCILNLP